MTDTKLPEWPDCSTEYWNKSAAVISEARTAYWEARCRLLYAAMEKMQRECDRECDKVGIGWHLSYTALRDCGPLPEELP